MVDCLYEVIVTHETDEQGHAYIGYGIEAWSGFGAERKRLRRVPDLFVSRDRCEAFVDMCNKLEVASFHLSEVIDNLLAE